MKKRYKLIIIGAMAVFMLRICLSNDNKNENNILVIPEAVVPITVTPDLAVSKAVNTNIFGINIGFAFKRELDKDSGFVQLLRDLHPSSLRFPGGTVANYYHPNLPVYGYKLNEIPPGLGTLYMEQLNRKENILYNYIRLCKLVGAGAVFCANVYTGNTEETLFVIGELKKNKIPIQGVELGNEFCLMEYRNKFPDANAYIKKIKATAFAIRARYPDLKIVVIGGDGVPANEMNARSKFMRGWNQVLSKENFYQAYTWHPYENCAACDGEAYFDKIYTNNLIALAPQQTKHLFNLGMNLAAIFGPNRKLWLTEWNVGNLKYLDNTFVQGAYVSENFLTLIDLNTKFNNYFEVSNLHSIDGLMTIQKGKIKPLLANGIDMATTQYFGFKFLSSTLNSNVFRASETISCKDSSVAKNFICNTFVNKKENKTYLHFVNRSGKKVKLNVNARMISSVQINSIEADYPYATAGKTFYEKEYPNKLKPVTYRNETVKENATTIAPYSFGYISYVNK